MGEDGRKWNVEVGDVSPWAEEGGDARIWHLDPKPRPRQPGSNLGCLDLCH